MDLARGRTESRSRRASRCEVVRSARPYPPDRKGSRPAALLFHALDLLDSVRAPRALRRRSTSDWDLVHAHRLRRPGCRRSCGSTPAPVVVTVHDYSLVDTRSNTAARRGRPGTAPPLLQRLRTAVMSRAVAAAHLVFPSASACASSTAHGGSMCRRAASCCRTAGGSARRAEPRRTMPARAPAPSCSSSSASCSTRRASTLLLEAWGDGLPGAELWIAGFGPARAQQVDEAAADGRVRNLGWLDDTRPSTPPWPRHRSLVLPSTWPEIFLLAAAEGALAGPAGHQHDRRCPTGRPRWRDRHPGRSRRRRRLRAAMVRLLDPALRSRLAAGCAARSQTSSTSSDTSNG